MIGHSQYGLLLVACLVITFPLEPLIGARVYRRPVRLVGALVPVLVIFGIWDVVGIVRGHWTYNSDFVSGVELAGVMPIEELAFFVVIPICGLLSYEAVGRVLERARQRQSPRQGADA